MRRRRYDDAPSSARGFGRVAAWIDDVQANAPIYAIHLAALATLADAASMTSLTSDADIEQDPAVLNRLMPPGGTHRASAVQARPGPEVQRASGRRWLRSS